MLEMKHQETDLVIRISNPKFVPLNFPQMVDAVSEKRKEFSTTIFGNECDEFGVETGEPINVKTSVILKERAPFFCLVKGGVLPPLYLLQVTDNKFLLDRNAVGKIQQTATDAGKQAKELDKAGATFDPAFAALEGADQRVPTLEEFEAEYKKFGGLLSPVFEHATVLPFDKNRLQALHEFQTRQLESELVAEMELIEKVAPLLENTVKKEAIPEVSASILQLTEELDFPRQSFLFLAILSILYGAPSSAGNAARKVLKPKAGMSDQLLYNVGADLRQLKLLAISQSLSEDSFALLSDDTGLAMLWAGLNVVGAAETEAGIQYRFSPHPDLFSPTSIEEIEKLIGD